LEEADAVEGVKVFHAGTTNRDGGFYTAGDASWGLQLADRICKLRCGGRITRFGKIGLKECTIERYRGEGAEQTTMSKPQVSIVMGSDSDLEIMREPGGRWRSLASRMRWM